MVWEGNISFWGGKHTLVSPPTDKTLHLFFNPIAVNRLTELLLSTMLN